MQSQFAEANAARERALPLCREVIRLSANSIRAVHRGEFDAAAALIDRGRAKLAEVDAALASHPAIYYAGFVHDAQKEFAEASLTFALVSDAPLPAPAELGVSVTLVGFSLGGAIALQLALDEPERIASVTLICSGLKPATASEMRKAFSPVRTMLYGG